MASLGWKIELYFLLTSSLTLAKRGKEGEKVLVEFLISFKANVTLKSVNEILPKNNSFMVGSLTAFHYEGSDFAVYSTFRMHSSYDIYKSACHCLCAVCELKSLGERFFIDGRIN